MLSCERSIGDQIENQEKTINNMAMSSGDYVLEFVKGNAGYSVKLKERDSKKILYISDMPAIINTVRQGGQEEEGYTTTYNTIEKQNNNNYVCTAEITSSKNSVFVITDIYSCNSEGIFEIDRTVNVRKHGGDYGFSSQLFFSDANQVSSCDGYEYFIPSILYRDVSNMRTHNTSVSAPIGGELGEGLVFVKETRTGTPLIMMRNKNTGSALSMLHLHPQISVGKENIFKVPNKISEDLHFGSLGYDFRRNLAIGYTYPCAEGPTTYNMGNRWVKYYHPVNEGFFHSYKLLLIPTRDINYQEAMVHAFHSAYKVESFDVSKNIDNDVFYDLNIELFSKLYCEYKSPTVTVAGLPFDVSVMTGKPFSPISFYIGFSGAQAAVGYHLLRAGIEKGDFDLKRKGETILNFWSSHQITGTTVPVIWWDPPTDSQNDGKIHLGSAPLILDTNSNEKPYPSFLRCFVDGMESLLDAYVVSARHGEDKKQWKQALLKTADFLVAHQNTDGSFCRAYNLDGTICLDNSNHCCPIKI
jgi:hypothetical protein